MSTLRRTIVALACSVVVAGLLPSAPAFADDPWPVPDPATITITGDGYGHGKGLSQWGAQGAAEAGLGYRQILRFYYAGTGLGQAGGQVKVHITADDDNDLVVNDRRGLTARDLSTGRTWKLEERGARRWRIRPVAGGNQIAYRTSRWHVWRAVKGDTEIAAGGAPVELRTPDGVVAYRGALRSTMWDTGSSLQRVTVNVVPLDAYVKGVVPREVIASLWEVQALRAQAVAARTYAVNERATTNRIAFDLCDTAACQVYGGFTAEYPAWNDAVVATARQVATFQGEVIYAQFSASNGGYTVADPDCTYLTAKADPYDEAKGQYYGWTATLTDADVERQWPSIGNLLSISIDERDGNGGRGGRVLSLTLTGDRGAAYPTGEDFRRRFGMRSTMFEISDVQPG